MALVTYTYSISADFPATKVDAGTLHSEITSSGITIALDGISTSGDVCSVTFKAALTAPDKTLLDGDIIDPAGGLIGDHLGVPIFSQEPALDVDGSMITVLKGATTQIGMQAVQVLNLPDLAADLVKSWQITAPANTIEILDIYIGGDLVGPNEQCYLSGGEYRCRTSASEGSSLTFEVVDRNDILGLFSTYGLSQTKLSSLTAFSGGLISGLAAGDVAIGATSGAKTTILSVGIDFLSIEFHETGFSDGEVINFYNSLGVSKGISCALGSWDEGDVIAVGTSVKDEWIEGFDERNVSPGGSKLLPKGLYFRVKCFNSNLTTPLRIKVSLTVGRL